MTVFSLGIARSLQRFESTSFASVVPHLELEDKSGGSSDFSRRNTMEVGSPSRMAILTAIHRAAHFLIDDPPKILADLFARDFAGFSSDKEFLAVVDSYAFPDFAAHRAMFALRQ